MPRTTDHRIVRCSRCNRRMRNPDGWNGDYRQGVLIAYICPDCQTPAENAEAETKMATLIYTQDDQGRAVTMPASDVLTLRNDPPGTCVGCRRPTKTVVVTLGEAELHLTFALVLGVADEDARVALEDYTGAMPGKAIDGTYPVTWWLCRSCGMRIGMPNLPVPYGPGVEIPTYPPPVRLGGAILSQ